MPPSPLFLDQSGKFFWRPGTPLSKGLADHPPLPTPLKVWIQHWCTFGGVLPGTTCRFLGGERGEKIGERGLTPKGKRAE